MPESEPPGPIPAEHPPSPGATPRKDAAAGSEAPPEARPPRGSRSDPPEAKTAKPSPGPGRGGALRVTLRLDVGGRATLGPGKVRLLELIGEHGSISAAGRAMGMSYRRAWTLVESLNAAFTAPVVEAHPGGAGGGGAALQPLGAEVVRLYRALERGAAEAGAAELERLRSLLDPPA